MSNTSRRNNRGRRVTSTTPATQTIEIVVPRSSNPRSAKQKKGRKRTQRTRTQQPKLIMKDCTARYMKCLLDPWATTKEELPCIPDLYDVPSQKICTQVRGVFYAGTTGFGFVSIAPLAANNDKAFALYSEATYTGSIFPVPGGNLPANCSRVLDSQIPWTTVTYPNYRVVACGIRVRYIGTELDRSGQVIPVRANNDNDDVDGDDVSDLLARPDHVTLPVDRRWHGTIWIPATPNHYAYTSYGSNGAYDNGFNQLGVAVTGTVAGNAFEYHVVRYLEAIPRNDGGTVRAVSNSSKSHSDVTGLSAVRDFLGSVTASQMGQSAIQAGVRYLKAAASAYSPGAGLLLTGAQQMMGPRAIEL